MATPITAAEPTKTTTLSPTLFIEAGAGLPVSGDVEFKTDGLETIDYYQSPWTGSATAGLGVKWVTETTTEVKVKPDTTTAASTDTATPATKTQVRQSGIALSAVVSTTATGYTAPDIIDSSNTTFSEASMALTNISGGLDFTYFHSSGLSFGVRPQLGVMETCDSTGAPLSVDCNSGYVKTSPVTRFYMDSDSYKEVAQFVGTLTLTGAYDLWSPSNVQDGGVSVYTQFTMQPFAAPVFAEQLAAYGGTHVAFDSGRSLPTTMEFNEMPAAILIGLRFEGNPVDLFKPKNGFLGRRLTEPKPVVETAPAPERQPEF